MRLGIDFDNTFADFGGLLRVMTLQRTGVDLHAIREANPDTANIEEIVHAAVGKERFEALIADLLMEDHSATIEPRPGALEVARRLAGQHDLVIVTARSERESVTPRRWLARHAIPVADFIATDYGPKASHAMQLGLRVHLDDNVSVFADFDAAHPTIPALIEHPMNLDHPRAAHWRSVEDWLAFERLVQSLERERA